MSNYRAFNVECYSELRRVTFPHPHITVKTLKTLVRDEFSINYPFVLTYQNAELCDKDQLEDLSMDPNCVIRVRKCSIDPYQSKITTSNVSNSSTDIFLSYEWTHQREVKLLERYLVANNYSCWLDVKEMHPGALMHPAIEQGIRQSSVFICCINRQYGESDNCRRELSTAIVLKKPIIPLMMEKLDWPPKNIATMVSEYIYIKFFKNAAANEFNSISSRKIRGLIACSSSNYLTDMTNQNNINMIEMK